MCRRSSLHWFHWWVWTYDPRLTALKMPAHLPFDLWPRQAELVMFLDNRVALSDDGLIEKSRDIGFTWLMGGYALHKWLFVPGFKTAFGSRVEDLVDKKGVLDTIFEKIRMMLYRLPHWMQPRGFSRFEHDNYMRLVNPANSNTISGEAGDQMGRGGRNTMYVIDEAAFIEHGESVEASTSGNSDIRIWGSSVNGMGNIFAKKRHGGSLRPDQIFRFHYSDDPRKTPDWAAKKKRQVEPHIWASEYELDYSASVEGICIPALWVMAAVTLGERLKGKVQPSVHGVAGLDVGAGGKGKSVWVGRFGPVIKTPKAWGQPDTIETAHRALDECADAEFVRADGHDCRIREMMYDSPGVGAGVSAALSRMDDNPAVRWNGTVVPVNTGDSPTETKWPDDRLSEELFANLKAELWWMARARFKASYELLMYLDGKTEEEGAFNHPHSDIFVLPSVDDQEVMKLVGQLSLPKTFRNEKGKYLMESKKDMAKRGLESPDYADALILTMRPSAVVDIWEKMGSR